MKLTKLETKIVKDLAWSCHSSDGHGLGGWLNHYEYNMKTIRGVMASLIKKKVAFFETDYDDEDATWGYIAAEYQEKVSDEDLSKYSEFDKSMIEDTNFRLVNLEFGEA